MCIGKFILIHVLENVAKVKMKVKILIMNIQEALRLYLTEKNSHLVMLEIKIGSREKGNEY